MKMDQGRCGRPFGPWKPDRAAIDRAVAERAKRLSAYPLFIVPGRRLLEGIETSRRIGKDSEENDKT